FQAGGAARDYQAPGSVAVVEGLTAGDFILEARMHHRSAEYAHQDLVVVYNMESRYRFYYTHMAPIADEGANTIFLVDNAPRTSIALERTDGTKWGERWYDVRIVRDTAAGTILVYIDDMSRP